MVCREVIDILEEHSPGRYACTWDNVGLLVGDFGQEVKTVYIALDATDEAIEEAAAAGADLLLTHPLRGGTCHSPFSKCFHRSFLMNRIRIAGRSLSLQLYYSYHGGCTCRACLFTAI